VFQARKDSPSSSGGTPQQGNSSFQAYGFGAGGRAAALRAEASSGSGTPTNMSRRGSHVNVNITPTQAPDNSTPEIRRYTKRLGSDILCGSLWGGY